MTFLHGLLDSPRPPAERQLKVLAEPAQKRIVKRLRTLKDNPWPQGVKKLAGEEDLYRIREDDYRIVYTIQDKKLIVLVGIARQSTANQQE